MIDIVLVEPEIPNNTGAIARTCACTGARLHLVKPLGFDISDSAVKRAGLDYWHLVDLTVYDDLEDYFARRGDANLWLTTTKAPPRLRRVRLERGCDVNVWKRDCRAARMAAREIPRPLCAHTDGLGGEKPQPCQTPLQS